MGMHTGQTPGWCRTLALAGGACGQEESARQGGDDAAEREQALVDEACLLSARVHRARPARPAPGISPQPKGNLSQQLQAVRACKHPTAPGCCSPDFSRWPVHVRAGCEELPLSRESV